MRTGTCESCGSEDESVRYVRRYYVTPERWDTPGSVQAADDEWWCASCVGNYPHEALPDPDPDPDTEQTAEG